MNRNNAIKLHANIVIYMSRIIAQWLWMGEIALVALKLLSRHLESGVQSMLLGLFIQK
jgi:hypothetical protein